MFARVLITKGEKQNFLHEITAREEVNDNLGLIVLLTDFARVMFFSSRVLRYFHVHNDIYSMEFSCTMLNESC